jgi:hypothetical protein
MKVSGKALHYFIMRTIVVKSVLLAVGTAAHSSPSAYSKEELERKWGTDVRTSMCRGPRTLFMH